MSVCSRSGIACRSFLSSIESNRQSSTLTACSEKIAKLTPAPSHVAPSGYGLPGQTLIRFPLVVDVAILGHPPRARTCGGRKDGQTQANRVPSKPAAILHQVALMGNGQSSSKPPTPRQARSAGILLHVTSLPGKYGIGDL